MNKTKILGVIDMQNDFIDGVLGTKEAVVIVDKVVEKIKNFEGTIFATLDTHYDNYLDTQEGKKLPVPHCIKMSDGWLINDKIREALIEKNCKFIEKETFGSQRLATKIGEIDYHTEIESIELVGVCTDICVVSNAIILKNEFPEIEIIVDASCCAGVTSEKHKFALETMKSCQIEVIGE